MKEELNSLPRRVIAFTKYGMQSASVRHRYLAYSSYLAIHSLDLTIFPLFSSKYFKKKILKGQSAWGEVFFCYFKRVTQVLFLTKPACVIVHTEMTPYLPGVLEFILRLRRIPYIVDIDDALFHQYDKHPNVIVRSLLNKKIGRIMKYSTAVFAGNEYIASYAREWNAKKVAIIPTIIDMERYINKKENCKEAIFTIVWIGSPSTTRYLLELMPILAKVCKGDKARVRLIGAKEFELPDALKSSVIFLPWSEDREVDLISECHVGIMPLPNTDWERGKCGFKLIQYMGCSLPVIASPVGVNSEIVEHGNNGYLASTLDEWETALVTLRDKPNLLSKMGCEALKKVRMEYSIQVWSSHYVNLLQSIILSK